MTYGQVVSVGKIRTNTNWNARNRSSNNPGLLPFKKGAFILAIKAQAPVVPVAIVGASQAMRKGSPVICPATLRVRIGRPVETAGLTLDDRERLSNEVRERIASMLAAGPCA